MSFDCRSVKNKVQAVMELITSPPQVDQPTPPPGIPHDSPNSSNQNGRKSSKPQKTSRRRTSGIRLEREQDEVEGMVSQSILKRCKTVGSIGQCSLANNEISLPTCTPNVSIENLQKKCPNVILGDKGQHEIAQNCTNSCTANSIVALLPHFFNNELNKDFILDLTRKTAR